ncbi:hypothetical protein BpHYR1_035241 [Brachionus plicatilis]|uniref:Uncharacterized protein n=1 Tax=Brachionus plicatilis TaxID=10195 RepID=A0A3M7R281_BRAPC|nr:hypothetical protein BpHYR1_035241 [Brachionus plicatilis]
MFTVAFGLLFNNRWKMLRRRLNNFIFLKVLIYSDKFCFGGIEIKFSSFFNILKDVLLRKEEYQSIASLKNSFSHCKPHSSILLRILSSFISDAFINGLDLLKFSVYVD